MICAIEFASFNLKNGVSLPDFLLASDKMNNEFLSAQKGYISRQLLVDGDTWADLVLWETIDDARHAAGICHDSAAAVEYFSYIECDYFHDFSIKKSYDPNKWRLK